MKKIILFIFCACFINLSYSISPTKSNNALLYNLKENHTKEVDIANNSYQQFKYQMLNFETGPTIDHEYYKPRRRKKKNDNLMLFVAGGLAIATGTLILTNDPENFTSNSAGGVNTGIAIAGTVACGMIVAKFYIDKGR